jgi:hypothetical protein
MNGSDPHQAPSYEKEPSFRKKQKQRLPLQPLFLFMLFYFLS